MRPFEIVLLAALLSTLLWLLLNPNQSQRSHSQPLSRIWLLLPSLAAIAQLGLEGYRWQLVPAYILAILMGGIAIARRFRPPLRTRKAVLLIIVGCLFWLVAAALPLLLPIPELPSPTGPFAVGTLTVHLVDESRADPYSNPPGQPREIMMQVWYPAPAGTTGQRAPYMDKLEVAAEVLAKQLEFPTFFLDHLQLVQTHSFLEAPVVDQTEPFPVLVFSHGLSGFRSQNTYQMEELASQGYVIAAADHTYAASMTVLPPERVRIYNSAVIDRTTPASLYRTSNVLIKQWAGDIRLMLDQLEQWQLNAPLFAGKLNMQQVGVFGHSTGAGATIEFCSRDDRCQASLLLDGWFEPVSNQYVNQSLAQPMMFIQQVGGLGSDLNKARMDQLFSGATGERFRVEISGAKHYDFADIPLLSPITPWLGLSGEISPGRGLPIINAYTRAFFDHTLRGTPQPLLTGPSDDYPEVSFESR